MGEWRNNTLRKIGYTYSGLSGKSAADFGDGLPYIPYMNVFANTIIDIEFIEHVNIGIHERQNKVIQGDALFTTSSETPDEVGMASVLTQNPEEIYLNSFCFGYRLFNKDGFDSKFLAYLLRSDNVRHQMMISAQGSTRHNLSKKNFYNTTIDFPVSIKEQRKIAEILATVDEAISKTSILIQKYTNIKAGMMQNLLINGIDESGVLRSPKTHKYKNSSLGCIPVEWDCTTIGEITSKVGSGATPRGGQSVYLNDGILFIRSQNVSFDGLILEDVAYISEHMNSVLQRSQLEYNDVLLNITGASIGRCCVYDLKQPANVNQHVCIIRTTLGFDFARFINNWISMFGQNQINILMAGSNREGLNFNEVKALKLPLIINNDELRKINNALNSIGEKIQTERNYLVKLQNIKKGLMQNLLDPNGVSVDALL